MKKKNVLLVIGLIVYVGIMIGVISYTYSYYTASATNTGVISGTAASYDLEVTVTKVENSGTGDLVPQLDSTITKAIQGTNGTLCLDGNGNTVCQVYKIEVENLSNANLVVYGYLDLNEGSNPNLKWAEVDGVSNPSLLSSVNSYTTTLLANEDDLEVNSINTYYVVIWISETGSSQSDTGDFTGVVTFSTEQMDYAKQTLVKLGLANSVSSEIPNFDYTSEYEDENSGICEYEGKSVISFVNGVITEDSCKTIYMASIKNNDTYITGYFFDASAANNYVGEGVWDSTNLVCKYDDNEVKDVYANTISDENLCGDVYKLSETYYSGIEEVGSGTWENLTGATGIYAAEDDLGTSYYFRGAVNNNWVYFAGIYWRIIRINGDGSIRMIYSGTTAPTSDQAVVMTGSGTQITTTKFNTSYNDNKYVGYTYDNSDSSNNEPAKNTNTTNNVKFLTQGYQGEQDSTIKETLDSWYEDVFLNTEYEQYLVDAIYCNDREVSTNTNLYNAWNTAYPKWASFDATSATLGQGTTQTLYKSDERLGYYGGTVSPTLKCSQNSDKYTVSTSLGNGKLKYKVGLITADEIVMAGARDYEDYYQTDNTYTLNTTYYLYTNTNYWSLTPRLFDDDYASLWGVSSDAFNGYDTGNALGARPVVSLSSNAIKYGNGSYSSPFRIANVDTPR